MCGGSKGQSTTQQTQTYQPNPLAISAISGALGQAQNAASLPFNIPQAPVAGFSPDQLSAFQSVNNAQGMALPYINQAANYFGQSAAGPNVSQFFNPYAGAVSANLQDIFGQQATQNTANLTQAAGGVGADRIAVGQSELAKQQGLAAGQTFAQLYQPSLSAALQEQNVLQGAGFGIGALGPAAQNSVLQGAQAQLGTGGLQQQLQQAQLNAPYQLALAQAGFPYQQSNFLTNAVASLAPGLGGTTAGQGTYTPPQPSLFSQILGGAGVGTALLGASGAFGGNGWLTGSSPAYGGGNAFTAALGQDAYGGSSANPLPGLTAADYGAGFSRGGSPNPYVIDLTKRADGSYGYDDGGVVSEEPGIAEKIARYVSNGRDRGQRAFYNDTRAGLWNSATAPEHGSTYGGTGNGLNTRRHLQMHEAQRIEDAVRGYDDGGTVSDEPIDIAGGFIPQGPTAHIAPHIPQVNLNPPQQQQSSGGLGDILKTGAQLAMMFAKDGGAISPSKMRTFDGHNPYAFFADGGTPDDDAPATFDERFPYRMPSPEAVDNWEKDADAAMAFAPQNTPAMARAVAAGAPAAAMPALPAQALSPYSAAPPNPSDAPSDAGQDFAKSPWAALMAAGLGIMGGSSPFAGVNIGQGGLQGLKMLEQQRAAAQKDTTIEQAAKRLDQEAKFHEDQYSRMTPYQRASVDMARQKEALEAAKPFKIGTDKNGFDIMGVRDPQRPGQFINAMTGQPVDPAAISTIPEKPASKTLTAENTGILNANAELVGKGSYDYTQDAPYIEKGMDVPEPEGAAGRSSRSLQTDAEYYLQTGKLPPVRGGKSPVAVAQQNYRNAVQNYAGALAQSRGLTPEQTADMWRTAPGMLRFILGADGRSTVALGTAVRHLDTLQQYANAWKANDQQAINRLRAVISREFGEEAATNLEAASRIVGPEIIKAIGVAGAGTAEERTAAAQGFSTAASPEQMAGAIKVTQALLGGQLEGRQRQAANAGVSAERFKSLIGDRPYEILTHIDKGTAATPSSAAPSKPAVVYQNGHEYHLQPDGSYK